MNLVLISKNLLALDKIGGRGGAGEVNGNIGNTSNNKIFFKKE